MSIKKPLPSIAAFAVCAALTTPLLPAKDKAVLPPDDPYVAVEVKDEVPENVHRGYGHGTIALPTVCEEGKMVGVVADCDGPGQFRLEAQLTGCLPLEDCVSGVRYWFGGLYGQMTKLPDSPAENRPHTVTYYVEGMWVLDKNLTGRLEAQLWRYDQDGVPFVAGLMDGKFCVHPAAVEGPDDPWSGAARPTKDTKTRYRDARHGPPWRDAAPDAVKDPFDDAGSPPTKGGGKSPFGNAQKARPWDVAWTPTPKKGDGGQTQWAKAVIDEPAVPWADARPEHKGWRDAQSQPLPALVGDFGVRFCCFCE